MELKPYFEVERFPCPFYRFRLSIGDGGFVMKESKKNRCAEGIIFYNQCLMELYEDEPNWSKCLLNVKVNREKLAKNLENMRVFPEEFRPPGKKGSSWEGMLLKDWMIYISNLF